MHKWIIPLFAMISLWTLPLNAAEELRWTGCGITKTAFMAELATAFEKQSGIKIVMSGGGATKGIRAVAAKGADLGGTCRPRLPTASGEVVAEEREARLILVAWDALVVIVHPTNPVTNISLDNLKKVYLGEIDSWAQMGGEDKKIALIDREGKESGVGHMFRRLAFHDPQFEYKARSLKVKSSLSLEQRVESFPTAMGVDGVSSSRKRGVKILDLDGIPPTPENIRLAKYAFYRPLYLVINRHEVLPQAQTFVDFALSPQGQEIIAAQGVVNIEAGKGLAENWRSRFGDQEP